MTGKEGRVLVLLAGGYPEGEVPKHLLKYEDYYLFERMIAAVPADNVWIVHNHYTLGFWNQWLVTEGKATFPDKHISTFLDKQNTKGEISNPSYWMSSSAGAIALGQKIPEVIFSSIDTFYKDFNFMDKFIEEPYAFTIGETPIYENVFLTPPIYVDLDWRGRVKEVDYRVPTHWFFANMVKVETATLVGYGQMPKGNMASVVKNMMQRGTLFKAIKAGENVFDCGTGETLAKAEHLYGVHT